MLKKTIAFTIYSTDGWIYANHSGAMFYLCQNSCGSGARKTRKRFTINAKTVKHPI
jgi:tRNA U34 2-thiouridine synthase MnmA/TrmU